MKKSFAILLLFVSLSGCSILSELTALTKCEFKFHSAQEPTLAGIDMMKIQSYTDLSFFDGKKVLTNILQKQLPFSIIANVEAKNPGPIAAAVNYIDWIAYIDDVEISTGRINDRVEIPGNGGTAIIPIHIQTDLFEFLEGDSPKTMLNFGLNLIDAGGQPTRLSIKIKPSVNVGSKILAFPNYFTISKKFVSGQ